MPLLASQLSILSIMPSSKSLNLPLDLDKMPSTFEVIAEKIIVANIKLFRASTAASTHLTRMGEILIFRFSFNNTANTISSTRGVATAFTGASSRMLLKLGSMPKVTPNSITEKHNTIIHFDIPEEGIVLLPNMLYLGVTEEYTETHEHVPFLEGKSSTGRLGIDIHATAGKGDVGFCGNWTLEISVKQPVRVYKGMPIGQLIYFPVDGEIEIKYNQKKNAKYSGQPNKPVESMMWKNKF